MLLFILVYVVDMLISNTLLLSFSLDFYVLYSRLEITI
jgi:hypothetical protein